ncbi:TRIM64 [Cervus elaphus hippelaphus]|uniref:TRIM64 n=1 Tax=Cervus elaphus hippelaphus TaxID=46360 RepID=A0A212DH44_CEREH|nr:TRIM64 [Cervus elaphus hippelaphus]
MDSDTLQVFQSELTCSICMNGFLDPITIDCGHSFCRPCLSLCWEEGQAPRSCPECRGISERPDFKTNIVLKRLASLARQARADHDHRSEEQICETRQEARGLFCEADQTLLCRPCSERPEHAAHSHSPIHRAAEESRDYVALRKVMIKLKYQRILRLLRDEEQLHLRALEKEAKEIYEQLKEIVFRMTQQRESLKEIDRELTEMCHMLDMELLQGLENVLEMTDLAQIQKPQPVNPELPSWPVAGFLNMLNNFRMNNVLSRTTTVHHVILDDASVLFEDDHPGGSRQPRGGACAVSWGGWAFTSGRQYWELDVSLSSSWVLGVCKSIFTRDTSISIGAEEAFFSVFYKGEQSVYSVHHLPTLRSVCEKASG